MLNKEIPFIRIGLPLCAGIISGLFIKPEIPFLLSVVIISFTGLLVSVFYTGIRDNLIFGLSFTISLFLSGLLLYTIEKKSLTHFKSEETIFSCTLSDFPEEKGSSYRLKVKLDNKISGEYQQAVKGSILLYSKKDLKVDSLIPGDNLVIRCTPLEIVNRGNPDEFDYRFYMENHGIRYYAFISGSDMLSHLNNKNRKLVHRALIVRERIIDMYRKRGIKGERLALVAAITLGQKSMLDPEQKQNFIKAGVMHIMAVSGLHAVIISLFVYNLLFFLRGRFGFLRIFVTILILWSFAYVTGLTPSVLRATLMFSFLQAGKAMKREVNGINSVLASAFVLILIRPSVIFDAGFLLSYSAVIFIICFYKELYTRIPMKYWLQDKIWQSAVVTIIAQAGTLPLTIMLFNRFPTYFIITNIVIVPIASLVVIMGCLVPFTFPLNFLSRLFAGSLNWLSGLTELLTEKSSSLPLSTIENLGMTTVECFLLTVTIFLFFFSILKRNNISSLYPLTAFLLYLLAGTSIAISSAKTNELIVFNTIQTSNIGIKTGKMLYLYSDSLPVAPEVKKYCATRRLRLRAQEIERQETLIRAGEKMIMISSTLRKKTLQYFRPDIIIITGENHETANKLSGTSSPDALIVTSGKSARINYQLQSIFGKTDTVHIVKQSGAFKTAI